MQTLTRPCIKDFPFKGNPLAWITDLASTLWNDISELDSLIQPMLDLECDRHLVCEPPAGHGWFEWLGSGWKQIKQDVLPPCLLVDVESHQNELGKWEAFLCIGLAADGTWYCWQGQSSLIPSNTSTLFIGHNASEHDSQFFTSEYLAPSAEKTAWLDTRAMVEILRGIHPEQFAIYEKFSKAKGGAPDWVSKACHSNLGDACRSFLGLQINKSVQGGILDGVEAPKSVFEYCCQDVWATLQLLQMVYPMARGSIQSPIWWWGQLAITGLRVQVSDWDAIILKSFRQCYEDAKKVKPKDRTESEARLVKWGASFLSRFCDASVRNKVMPLRVNPCNVFGAFSSDFTHWLFDNAQGPLDSWLFTHPEEGIELTSKHWDFAPQGRSACPLVLLANTQPLSHELCFTLPVAPVIAESRAKVQSTQPVTQSKVLKVRCPQSITGVEMKSDWLRRCDQPEVLAMFIVIMDAFIMEYELDAWLAVPGQYHAMYACRKREHFQQLQACGDEAIRIIKLALGVQ